MNHQKHSLTTRKQWPLSSGHAAYGLAWGRPTLLGTIGAPGRQYHVRQLAHLERGERQLKLRPVFSRWIQFQANQGALAS
jgi:hypothetical protein